MPSSKVMSVIGHWCGREKAGSLSAIIRLNAQNFSLDPKLIACIIYQESGGDEEAYREEEHFFEKYLRGKTRKDLVGYVPNFPPSFASELRARSRSFGVMQILGETARLMGYDGRWLPACRVTSVNVHLGCKYLRHLFDKAAKISDETARQAQVLTWWNGSAEYPPLIIDHMVREKWRTILL